MNKLLNKQVASVGSAIAEVHTKDFANVQVVQVYERHAPDR